jgi:hypothetical protein
MKISVAGEVFGGSHGRERRALFRGFSSCYLGPVSSLKPAVVRERAMTRQAQVRILPPATGPI